MLSTWGDQLNFTTAARIWFVSSLGRYVPGSVWSIGAMAYMSKEASVSPAAAAGSSVLNVAVNIGCGLAIAVGLGWHQLQGLPGHYGLIFVVMLILTIIGLALLPIYLPRIVATAERLSGRSFGLSSLSPNAVVYSIAGNIVAWLLYGLAFRALVAGIIGTAPGPISAYVVAWAACYVLAYLVIFLPAGAGIREVALVVALRVFELANPQQAVVISLSSRLWLTILDILPGLIFLAIRPRTPTSPSPE